MRDDARKLRMSSKCYGAETDATKENPHPCAGAQSAPVEGRRIDLQL